MHCRVPCSAPGSCSSGGSRTPPTPPAPSCDNPEHLSACCQMYPEGGGAKLPPGFTIPFVPFFTCISSPDRNLRLRSLVPSVCLFPPPSVTHSHPLPGFLLRLPSFALQRPVPFCFRYHSHIRLDWWCLLPLPLPHQSVNSGPAGEDAGLSMLFSAGART